MSKIRDNENNWTKEASKYTTDISKYIDLIIQLGRKANFSYEDIFYLVMTELNEQQLIKMLQEK